MPAREALLCQFPVRRGVRAAEIRNQLPDPRIVRRSRLGWCLTWHLAAVACFRTAGLQPAALPPVQLDGRDPGRSLLSKPLRPEWPRSAIHPARRNGPSAAAPACRTAGLQPAALPPVQSVWQNPGHSLLSKPLRPEWPRSAIHFVPARLSVVIRRVTYWRSSGILQSRSSLIAVPASAPTTGSIAYQYMSGRL